jgi:hypothetical protein
VVLPTREEINVHDSLDERCACDHFLGKTLREAEELFRRNSLYYQEDLIFMGPVAFRFYVEAAFRYLESADAIGDSDMVSCLASILEFRLRDEPAELAPIAKILVSRCGCVMRHYDRFEVDPEVYGDVRGRWIALSEALTQLK